MNEWDFKLRYVGSIYSWKNNEIVILFVGQILQVWDNVENKKNRQLNFNGMKWKKSQKTKKQKKGLGLLNQK